jgi:hypothetical protein
MLASACVGAPGCPLRDRGKEPPMLTHIFPFGESGFPSSLISERIAGVMLNLIFSEAIAAGTEKKVYWKFVEW